MNKILILCLLMVTAAGLNAAELGGRIVDPSGKGISSVLVSDGLIQNYSSEDGSFRISTQADSLSFRRLGYKARTLSVAELGKRITLLPEPVLLPKITVSDSAWDIFAPPADRVALPVDPDRHYYSAGEVLSSSSAAHSNDVRLAGESQGVSILGNLARHSLIILDGVALNPGGESYDLSLIDARDIESIELIKNNASVYGGGSAIGGILNIRSKRGRSAGGGDLSLSSEIGSFGYAKTSLAFGTAINRWDLRVSASHLDTDNDFPYRMPDWWAPDSVAIRENNAKRQNSLSASVSTSFSKARLSLQSDYVSFHRQLPGTVNFSEVYRHAFLEGYANRNRLTLSSPLEDLSADLLAWLNLDGTIYDNTRAPLAVYLSQYRQKLADTGLRGSLGGEFELGEGLTLNAGMAAELGSERYRNQNLLNPVNNLDHSSAFANASLKSGLELDLGDLIYTGAGALRFDHAGMDDNLSWRLEGSAKNYGYVETTLGGTWGTSFALPSPYDLYWRGDSQAIGNPDLASERSRGWQLWLENRLGSFHLRSAYHYNTIDSLIQWRQVQMFGNVWKPLNIGRARIRNLEIEAGWEPLQWLKLAASALFTDALDLSSQTAESAPALMYTPRVSYTLKLDLSWRKINFWSIYSYTGEQFTTPDNLTDPLPGYALLDLGAALDLKIQGWTLSPHFSVRNALNKSYSVYAYVPQPGISLYCGVTLRIRD
ncbi:MAG: TonB-dependent receptor plug domain-containing protein [Candidatus Cloacimonetes bacterium]|nr:TonB-dependent receptor plug domain-containing protein [Candidatus Cloacimonadota bacterium]